MLIGREEESRVLKDCIASAKSEFIAIYGRHRVGKTFLVQELLGKHLTFDMTGVIGGSKQEQLFKFAQALRRMTGVEAPSANTWIEAFTLLEDFLRSRKNKTKIILFIDELPCLDTPKAGFIRALDQFWNGWAAHQHHVKLIVCGSATSWMLKNIIDSHGGLHNRITRELHIKPFTLSEAEDYLKANGFRWNRMAILEMYSATGGVPYYLSLLDRRYAVAQNIDRLFFGFDALLGREFERLFKSLFKSPDNYVRIIELLAKSRKGLTREELKQALGINTGGYLTQLLSNLENCDFIRSYHTREKKIKANQLIYQITDAFTQFHFSFCANRTTDAHYWSSQHNTPRLNTWLGLSFERVSMTHVDAIKQALGIARLHTEYYAWRSHDTEPRTQIDLVIECPKQVAYLCEMKFSRGEYVMTAADDRLLNTRMMNFLTETGFKASVQVVMVTTQGLKANAYASNITNQVTLNDLFATIKR